MPEKNNCIIIAAGGTGGHVYPAIALGIELRERGYQIIFVIRSTPMVVNALNEEKFEFISIDARPFFGQSNIRMLYHAIKNGIATIQSIKILNRLRPVCVVGFGAYVSVPMVYAAFIKKIPTVIHEQNVIPGWSNRICAHLSNKIAVSFEESQKYFSKKTVLTGNLVRKEFLVKNLKNQSEIRRSLGLNEHLITILVFGGSAGAKSINDAMGQTLAQITQYRDTAQFIHISGSREESEYLKTIYQQHSFHALILDYAHPIIDYYQAADLTLCRSGATTIAELKALSMPAILIPYPYATGNHQFKNAATLESIGTAVIVKESKQFHQALASKLSELIQSKDRLSKMKESYQQLKFRLNDSTKILADLVIENIK